MSTDFKPLAYTIPGTGKAIGHGKTFVYELIGLGLLDARKSGKRTIVTAESIERYLATLPKASIRTTHRPSTTKST
jgi:hypothetical protein